MSRRRPHLRLALLSGLTMAGGFAGPSRAVAQAPPPSAMIAAGVVPLPAALRAGAGVVALDSAGRPRTLRPSTNGMVCITDPPGDAFFVVECYHVSFISVVYRMKQLVARGLPEAVLDQTIEAEIRDGRLKLPAGLTISYGMSGPVAGYDTSTNTVSQAMAVWHRLHVPLVTATETGLPSDDDGRHPYLMAGGTYYAHVMLTPPRPAPLRSTPCMGAWGC